MYTLRTYENTRIENHKAPSGLVPGATCGGSGNHDEDLGTAEARVAWYLRTGGVLGPIDRRRCGC